MVNVKLWKKRKKERNYGWDLCKSYLWCIVKWQKVHQQHKILVKKVDRNLYYLHLN